ncbi:hypothetical protein FBULB1_572 [Fusarium bulbicola]|nr:hypothetical protein FBULB1_572 [Fusarium bulbicola]
MNRLPLRDLLSSQYIINLMKLAYADEGNVLALRMTPPSGPTGWDVSIDLDGDHKGSYEFVVIDEVAHRLFILRDKTIKSPRSGGPIHDKFALEACGNLRSVGYAVLAWRPYCDEAMPFMDEDGNILPITERPLIHSLRELSGERLLQEYAQLKRSAICSEVQKIQDSMWGSVVTTNTLNAFEIFKKKLRFSHGDVEENVKELSSLHKEVKDLEAANNIGNKNPHMAELLEGDSYPHSRLCG